jgi:hypothetical protein
MIFRAEISIPPSLNNAYSNAPGRGRVPSKSHKDWKFTAAWELKVAKPPRLRGPYTFTILLPEKMRGDVSNRIKLAEDLFVGVVTPDDRHCVKSSAERCADVPPGRCVVIIESAA